MLKNVLPGVAAPYEEDPEGPSAWHIFEAAGVSGSFGKLYCCTDNSWLLCSRRRHLLVLLLMGITTA